MKTSKDGDNSQGRGIIGIAEAYLEERYGEPFTYAFPWDRGFNSDINMLMHCDSITTDAVAVHAEKNEDGSWTFTDNYLPLKFEQPIRSFLRQCAMTEFSDAYVSYHVGRVLLSGDIPGNITLNDYLKGNYYPLSVTIQVPLDEFKSLEQVKKVMTMIAETGIDFRINMISLKGDALGGWDRLTLNDAIVDKAYGCFAIATNNGGEIDYQWAEGEYR